MPDPTTETAILAWHFASEDMRLGYDDGRVIVPGESLSVDPEQLELCQYGLHASERIMDALYYARGSQICRVELSGHILRGNDKLCASERRCLWVVSGEQLLRDFARWCALQVIHLWDAPEVVRRYLETGDETLRSAAGAAAWASAGYAAGAAARSAARDAAWSAAWSAAGAAARSVACAAWDAAGAAARPAAWDAAWSAAGDAQNAELERRVLAAREACHV